MLTLIFYSCGAFLPWQIWTKPLYIHARGTKIPSPWLGNAKHQSWKYLCCQYFHDWIVLVLSYGFLTVYVHYVSSFIILHRDMNCNQTVGHDTQAVMYCTASWEKMYNQIDCNTKRESCEMNFESTDVCRVWSVWDSTSTFVFSINIYVIRSLFSLSHTVVQSPYPIIRVFLYLSFFSTWLFLVSLTFVSSKQVVQIYQSLSLSQWLVPLASLVRTPR